jgi:hypothetical protein
MKTEREKKLEIALLTEKLQRISGKKILFKENNSEHTPKVGDSVTIPKSLTTDPKHKQGESGEVVKISEGCKIISVKFADGVIGDYADGVVDKK